MAALSLAWVPWAFVLLWSTGFIGAKFGLPYVEPFTFLLIRMLLTLALFAGLIGWMRTPWPKGAAIGRQMLVGLLVHGAYLGGVFAAIKAGMPAGVTAILVGLQPLLTALLARIWFAERLRPAQFLGLWLGFAGVLLVISGRDLWQGQLSLTGLAWALTALLGISCGTLYQKKYGQGVPLLTGTFYQYVSTTLLMALLALVWEERSIVWHPEFIGALLWLVFGLSLAAILLLMLMIREGESAKVASYFYLVPPLTALESWLLFNENLGWISVLGMLLSAAGVGLALRGSLHKASPAPQTKLAN
ncbi:DMT family transporter [Balneatrix alpica]|uniref:DMT family transporter n=1 Tax=Balneatrix alpica TaxID=75684 RepID=A0ABV5ZAC1_9GAMM|nr:DMT family transporter [Balneatrix alpica]